MVNVQTSADKVRFHYQQYDNTPAALFSLDEDVVVNCDEDEYPFLKIALLKRTKSKGLIQ